MAIVIGHKGSASIFVKTWGALATHALPATLVSSAGPMLSAAVIDGGGSELSAALDGTLMMELAFIAIFPSIKLTEFLSNGMPKSAASRSYTIRTYRGAGKA